MDITYPVPLRPTLTGRGPGSGAVLVRARGATVCPLSLVVLGDPVTAAHRLLILSPTLDVQRLLGNGVLRHTDKSMYVIILTLL